MGVKLEETSRSPTAAECRALVERVASSAQFARSSRLRDFLRFVGQAALSKRADEVNEHEIGVRVFGRPPEYDRSQDNIVRVNATELRKRVDRYFELEGVDEPLTFSIPRGSYLPRFERRPPGAFPAPSTAVPAAPPVPVLLPEELEPETDAPPPGHPLEGTVSSPAQANPATTLAASPAPSPAQKARHWERASWIAATLLLVALAGWLLWQNGRLRRLTDARLQRPEVRDFWGSFASSAPQTDIVLPDASFIISDEILGKPLSLGQYTGRDFPGSAHKGGMTPDRQEDLDAIFGHNLVMLGDFRAAQQILTMGTVAPSLRLSFARFYEADSIRRSNVVLIGGRKANPWAQLFDDQLNFAMGHGGGHTPTVITNRHPAPGEQRVYVPLSDPSHLAAWTVVACLPNLGKTGKVLLIAGTDSDATSAAAEYLTSEEGLRTLREQLHQPHIGYFEALLQTSRLNGAPLGAELVAVRRR